MLRIVGAMISLRSRITKVATGDQAIFVRRDVFEKMGGYPDIPLMEDIALSRTLKRVGRVARARKGGRPHRSLYDCGGSGGKSDGDNRILK